MGALRVAAAIALVAAAVNGRFTSDVAGQVVGMGAYGALLLAGTLFFPVVLRARHPERDWSAKRSVAWAAGTVAAVAACSWGIAVTDSSSLPGGAELPALYLVVVGWATVAGAAAWLGCQFRDWGKSYPLPAAPVAAPQPVISRQAVRGRPVAPVYEPTPLAMPTSESAAYLEELGSAVGRSMAGWAGERAVAEQLALLSPDWVAIHNLFLRDGYRPDVDHLVLGPGGAFSIETKAKRHGPDECAQAALNATRCGRVSGGYFPAVRAVLCVAGDCPEHMQYASDGLTEQRVEVVPARRLVAWLAEQPECALRPPAWLVAWLRGCAYPGGAPAARPAQRYHGGRSRRGNRTHY